MNHSPKVLVVEDDVQQARIIQLRLMRNTPPFEVLTVNDAPAALEKLAKDTFDIVTLDYHLPSTTGLEVLQNIRKLYPHIPVVMLTGQGDEQIAVQAMRHGAQDYITKAPEHFDLLPRVLTRAIRENHLSQQLEASRKRYYDLFHNANVAIFVLDAETFHIDQMNNSAETLLAIPAEVWSQKAFFNLVAPEQQALIETFFSNIKKNGRAEADNVKLITPQKRVIPTEIIGCLVHAANVEFIELFVTDISEKIKMHRQLLLSQQRLLSLFNGITDLICVINNGFLLQMGNKRYLEFTSNTARSLEKKMCYQALFSAEKPCEGCPATKTMVSGESHFHEIYHNHHIYHIWTFPMRNLAGQPEFIVEYTKDVTDQKEMERQLIKSEKMASVGLLSSGIAHELRNPLNIIETVRYTIENDLNHQFPEIDKKLRSIHANVQRASAIIENLLRFSRHSEFVKEKIDVIALLRNTLSLVNKEIQHQNVKVTTELKNTPRVILNIDSLKQVFLNIILNAVQAMPNGGDLSIRNYVGKDDQWVYVEFRDSGVGISAENMNHIFTPFFTTKGPSEGTGLGLYLSYTLLKREGADILAESREGKGSKFTVKLPTAAQSAEK
ncbi:MAG: response regulator [Calditrichaeota bacterium]|nr:MAG: response regulator [Calditrichota bacterium]